MTHQDSSDPFRRFFDAAPIASLVLERDGHIARSNRAARELLGAEIDGDMLVDHVRRRSAQKLARRLQAPSPEPWAIEVDVRDARGATVPARIEAIPGRAGQRMVTLVDLGGERALRWQRQYADRLHEIAGVAILRLDRQGRIEHGNHVLEVLSGVALEEVRGTSWLDTLVPEADRERARRLFERCIDGGERFALSPGPIATADGTTRRIEWTGAPLASPGERATSMVCVGVDVTEIAESQLKIRAERERSQAILGTALDAIITVDEDGAIETFNPGARRLFGYSAPEAIGMNVGNVIPSLGAGLLAPRLLGKQRELEGMRKDGSVFPIHLSVSEIRVDSRRSFCAFVRDLTELREAEARLRHAHKLEAVGTLASGVAHDFNNLLMGVAGCADVALSRLPADSDARAFLEEIRRSAKSGAAITKQLLAFTRNDKLETAVFELNDVVARSRDMLQRLLGEDLALAIDLRAADSRIRADIGQIEQVLMNLTVNARDAMQAYRGGGSLVIETDTRQIGGRDFVVLRVADSGEGMSAETRERIFDPFFSTKPTDSGTGLGLSVVYGIVTRAGGSIQVSSELGEGTTFEVLLPHASGRVTTELGSPQDLATQAEHDVTVLITEDDLTVRMALRHYLETAGYRILEASDGTEAIRCIDRATGPIDLLLTDMVLPGSGGASVAKKLAEVMPDARVLFMSAHSSEWLVERGRLPAGARVLHKPFGQAELLAEIERTLATPRPRRQGTVLLVDDDDAIRRSLGAGLRDLGYEVLEAANGNDAIKLGMLRSRSIDALVVDAVLPQRMGVVVARELARAIPGLLVLHISGYAESVAVQRELVGSSDVFFEKPVSAVQVHQVIRAARRPPARPRSVLLVEDNRASRLALSELLADAGLDVETAETGAEADRHLAGRDFDVLLIDYALPDTRGDQVAARARQRTPDLSVIYMSGDPDLDLGADALHFVKPVDVESLKAAVLGSR